VPIISPAGASTSLASGQALITTGDITTASNTFVDLTGVTVTITTAAHRCLCVFSASIKNTAIGNGQFVTLLVDGTNQGGTNGLIELDCAGTAFYGNAGFSFVTASLTAASHTFKIQWRVGAGTSTCQASATAPAVLSVVELLA